MRNKLRRPLAFLLSAVMIVTMSGTPVHAVADRGQPETGLCEHHTAHTDDCGYTEETPGTPCGHEHTEDCYTEVTECVHEHTPECYRSETEDSVSGNEATPANAEKREPENCPHICDGESGCITEKLDCRHEHDSECGYTESTPGTPCTYVCEICNPQDSGEADEEPETGIIKQEHCSCLTLCTEGQINPDCPVCGAEDAGLSDCKGKAEKEDTKQPEDTGICKHHQEHDDACGYQPESEDSEGSPCTYECRLCPIEDLIAALPDEVTADNAEEVRAWLDEILALFGALTGDEQELVDITPCLTLQEQLDAASAASPLADTITLNSRITINSGNLNQYNNKVITGATTKDHLTISGVTINLTIKDLSIQLPYSGDVNSGLVHAGIKLENNATLNLTLEGTNTIKGGSMNAAINVPAGCTLTISGSGSLTARGGDGSAGIGANFGRQSGIMTVGTININGGTIDAYGSSGGAGIGGTMRGSTGRVVINGGTVYQRRNAPGNTDTKRLSGFLLPAQPWGGKCKRSISRYRDSGRYHLDRHNLRRQQ